VDQIDQQQRDRIAELTRKLGETYDMEKMAKANFDSAVPAKENGKLGSEIQALTGEQHYMKTDDKDITALQENDTTVAHSKVTTA